MAGKETMSSKIGVPIYPTDRELAKKVHDDIWDLFSMLTREQSVVLIEYFESLTAQGVLVLPQLSTGGTDEPNMTDVQLGKEMRRFYTWADSRNVIPEEYKKAIEWFVKSAEEFDDNGVLSEETMPEPMATETPKAGPANKEVTKA